MEGLVSEQLNERRVWLMEICEREGYNYTDRLHIIVLEMFVVFDIIGWLGTICILFGYYLNTRKLEVSWIVWFLGNLFMLVYSVYINKSTSFTLVVLMGLNVYGYLNWRKSK